MKENIQQGMRSLSQHRLRTLLSTLGVLFGVVAVITMLSIGEGAKMETLLQIEQLGMNSIIIRQNELAEDQLLKARQQRSRGLSIEDALLLQQSAPHVQNHAALKVVEATINAAFTTISPEILATTYGFSDIKGMEVAEGRFICSLDVKQRSHVCVLGSEVAASLGKHGHVGQTISIDGADFQIVGVLRNKNWKAGKTTALTARNLNKNVFIPLGVETTLPNQKSTAKDAPLSEIILQIDHSHHMEQAAR